MRPRKIDLNLLRVFSVIMENRSVSGAARDLGVTASAVSHALARLRSIVGDELFVLADSGMEPTARALQIAPHVSDGLDRLATALGSPVFDPAEASRTFAIAASDYVSVALLPPLVSRLATKAPRIGLRVFPPSRIDLVRHLDDGRIDLAVNWVGELPDRMRRRTIAVEQEAIVVRPGHPLTSGPVTRKRLFAFSYVVVDLTGTAGHDEDGFLDDRGVRRRTWIERLLLETGAGTADVAGRVAVTVPTYAAVAPMLRATDMVATLPRRLALDAAERGALAILDLPYEPLRVEIEAIWHQRADGDAGLRWFIEELADATRAQEV